MTKQFVGKGSSKRSRSYSTPHVKVFAAFDRKNKFQPITITAAPDPLRSPERQEISMTFEECEAVSEELFNAWSAKFRMNTALRILSDLSDDELLQLLAKDLQSRISKNK
jgi:hypothetical protein